MTQHLGDRQRRVLEHLAGNPQQRETALVFYQLCWSASTVRSMFGKGWVEGDQLPAEWVRLTNAGRAMLGNGEKPRYGTAISGEIGFLDANGNLAPDQTQTTPSEEG
jgi:hypothetical protein